MNHSLGMLVEKSPDTLLRIMGTMRRHVQGVESFTLEATGDPELSRITTVVTCKDGPDRLQKVLEKLIGVLVVTLNPDDLFGEDLAPTLCVFEAAGD